MTTEFGMTAVEPNELAAIQGGSVSNSTLSPSAQAALATFLAGLDRAIAKANDPKSYGR